MMSESKKHMPPRTSPEQALDDLREVLRKTLGASAGEVLVLGVRYLDFDENRPVLSVGISNVLSRLRSSEIPREIDGFPVHVYRTNGPMLGG
jgi:hypothetical protein